MVVTGAVLMAVVVLLGGVAEGMVSVTRGGGELEEEWEELGAWLGMAAAGGSRAGGLVESSSGLPPPRGPGGSGEVLRSRRRLRLALLPLELTETTLTGEARSD